MKLWISPTLYFLHTENASSQEVKNLTGVIPSHEHGPHHWNKLTNNARKVASYHLPPDGVEELPGAPLLSVVQKACQAASIISGFTFILFKFRASSPEASAWLVPTIRCCIDAAYRAGALDA